MWLLEHTFLLISLFLFSLLLYFPMLSRELVNSYDGLWWHSNFIAGEWERSIGRWFWPYLDQMRFGILSISLNSVITFSADIFAICLITDLFKIKSRFHSFLVGALFLSSPMVCETLSYAYMSPTFGFAFLFSVIAAVFIVSASHWILTLVGAVVFIALSMGCYQAYLGVTCVLILFYCIYIVLNRRDLRDVLAVLIQLGASVIFGGLLYKLCVSLTNRYYDVTLTDYKGVGDISVHAIITSLPATIRMAYTDFYMFFFSDNIIVRNYGSKIVIAIFFIAAAILLISVVVSEYLSVQRIAVLAGLILLAPLFCNVTLLIAYASGGTILLMTGALVLLFSLIVCIFYPYRAKRKIYPVCIIFLMLTLWLNICSSTNDQVALSDGKTSTCTLTDQIVQKLIADDLLHEDTVIAFVGRPSESHLFRKTDAFNAANEYAKFGLWWVDAGNNRRSWYYGMIRHYLALDLNWCDDDDYNEILTSGQLEEMPCFPEKESIREINGILVVKVSDSYLQ